MQIKRDLGQNFLINKSVVKDLIKSSNLNSEDIVLEIGAGEGFVTKELAKLAEKVIAVEIDKNLIPKLKEGLKNFNNVGIINEDILKFLDFIDKAVEDASHNEHEPRIPRNITALQRSWKALGSIPYQITSPLVHKLLTLSKPPLSITLLIQYEVAKKITSKPPKATYLSNFVQTLAEVKFIKKINKGSFRPIPQVDGGIISIVPFAKPPSFVLLDGGASLTESVKRYSSFLHKGFSSPRKMLNKIFCSGILENSGIDPKKRAQELTIKEWSKLYTYVNTQAACSP